MENVNKTKENLIINEIIATHKLEGLEVEQCVLEDIRLVINNKLTTEQAIKKAFARIKNEQIQWDK